MRILTLDAALAICSAGLVVDGALLAAREARDAQAALPSMVQQMFSECGRAIDMVAVTVGPGSFTGLRSALALAHGIGLAAGVPVLGVTVGAAMARLTRPGRQFWAAIDSKRAGRIFLERSGAIVSLDLSALPSPEGPVAVAGDAAIAVASRLAAREVDVQLLEARRPVPLGIALAAIGGETRPAQPLYVDLPEARPGRSGRPAPA